MNALHFQFLSVILVTAILNGCASNQTDYSGKKSEIKPGTTTKSLCCDSDTNQKYAFYLPANYSPDKKWPLLICFDPHAEGLLPVNLFRVEAEKTGFIVAGSNNSKNGLSIDETTIIYRKIFSDITEHFSIDTQSVYVAGFSGGSRVAAAAAITEGNIAGVIGCGAGLPNLNRQPVRAFSYLAVSGIEDFNYSELKQVDETFEKAGYIHHLLVFDGIHQWPVKEVVPEIFTWLMFDRMRNNSIPPDRNQINAFIDSNYAKSEAAAKAGDILSQQSILLKMKHYLKGLTDVAPLESEISRLDTDPRIRKQKEEMDKLFEKEKNLQSEYASKMQTQGTGWWKQAVGSLQEEANKVPLTDEGRMYKRVLGFLSLNAYMYSNSALKQGNLEAADRFIEIYRLVDPTNAEHRYMAATVDIKKGYKDEAIKELQAAIKLGFKDFQRLRNDSVFISLHTDQRYNEIINVH